MHSSWQAASTHQKANPVSAKTILVLYVSQRWICKLTLLPCQACELASICPNITGSAALSECTLHSFKILRHVIERELLAGALQHLSLSCRQLPLLN